MEAYGGHVFKRKKKNKTEEEKRISILLVWCYLIIQKTWQSSLPQDGYVNTGFQPKNIYCSLLDRSCVRVCSSLPLSPARMLIGPVLVSWKHFRPELSEMDLYLLSVAL